MPFIPERFEVEARQARSYRTIVTLNPGFFVAIKQSEKEKAAELCLELNRRGIPVSLTAENAIKLEAEGMFYTEQSPTGAVTFIWEAEE